MKLPFAADAHDPSTFFQRARRGTVRRPSRYSKSESADFSITISNKVRDGGVRALAVLELELDSFIVFVPLAFRLMIPYQIPHQI